jgi:hypothetical protein
VLGALHQRRTYASEEKLGAATSTTGQTGQRPRHVCARARQSRNTRAETRPPNTTTIIWGRVRSFTPIVSARVLVVLVVVGGSKQSVTDRCSRPLAATPPRRRFSHSHTHTHAHNLTAFLRLFKAIPSLLHSPPRQYKMPRPPYTKSPPAPGFRTPSQ